MSNGRVLGSTSLTTFIIAAAATTGAACLDEPAATAPASTASTPLAAAQALAACVTTGGRWVNQPLTPQSGGFQIEIDATPSADGIDAVFGLSLREADEFEDVSAIVRFNPTGIIDVRDLSRYRADTVYAWVGGTTYHFRLTVNMMAVISEYTVEVRPAAGGEYVKIADRYWFRSEVLGVSYLNNIASVIDSGPSGAALEICAHEPVQAPPPGCIAVSAGDGFVNVPIPRATDVADITLHVKPSQLQNLDISFGLSDGPATQLEDIAATLRYSPDAEVTGLDGDTYRSEILWFYRPELYHYRFVADLTAHTFSVTQLGDGSSPDVVLVDDYHFRTTQSSADELDYLSFVVDSAVGTITVCDVGN